MENISLEKARVASDINFYCLNYMYYRQQLWINKHARILTVIVKFILADSDIRYCVLSSLDERFDAHLAQAENLSALFVALNDEVRF